MARTCFDCQFFRKAGGMEWGRCDPPYPVWFAAAAPKPKVITKPDDPELAPLCSLFVRKTEGPPINEDAVNQLLYRHRFRGRTAEAVKLVLLKGLTNAEAARALKVNRSGVTRMLQKLARDNTCPACGQNYRVGPGHLREDEAPKLPPLWPPLATELSPV